VHLCCDCDKEVIKHLDLPADAVTAKEKEKVAEGTKAGPATQESPVHEVQSEEDEEDEDEEEDDDDEEFQIAEERSRKSKKAKEKKKLQICRAYTFHKCPHGRSGLSKTRDRLRCLYDHPKVCPKLEAHGDRGPQGCTKGEGCDYWHPKFCYSSRTMPRVCTRGREACTYWHTKDTTYDAGRAERKVPPSQEARRRRQEESDRIRRTEETARRREEADYLRRQAAERREGEDRRPPQPNQFLDLEQMIRTEIHRAFRTMFPGAASGNSANPPPPPMGWALGRPAGC
jgi:hypothetical protein